MRKCNARKKAIRSIKSKKKKKLKKKFKKKWHEKNVLNSLDFVYVPDFF